MSANVFLAEDDMGSWTVQRRGFLFVAVAAALIVWGAIGYYRGLGAGFSEGLYDPDYRVPAAPQWSVAGKSGFKAGDRVISVEGTPVGRLGMESRWPRALVPRAGESRRFVVERNGEWIPLTVVYPPPSTRAVNSRIAAALAGLGFLCSGLWAFLTAGTQQARALAHIGLAGGAAMALGGGPNLGSWNGVKGHVSTAVFVFLFVLLLRFFVTFPRVKPVSRSRLAAWLVYGAWGCLIAFLIVELIVHPALYYTTGSVTGLLTLAYVILILAAIAHTTVKTPAAELRESGMYLILAGLVAVFAAIATAIAIGVNLPGWAYALAITAIPFSMALAARRQARSAKAAGAV